MTSTVQPWLSTIPLMQQSVLLSAIRGCDGVTKEHGTKPLMRWLRRCILVSAFDKVALNDPLLPGGGQFTGPLKKDVPLVILENPDLRKKLVNEVLADTAENFLNCRDEIPTHFFLHVAHAAEILGYKHPVPEVRMFWQGLYHDICKACHMSPESEANMNHRLGDNENDWRQHDVDVIGIKDLGLTRTQIKRRKIEEEERNIDDQAVDRFAAAMKEKLAKKRRDGRHGWHLKSCQSTDLSDMLRDHIDKGDPVDVANFCMMIHQKGDKIT